MKLLPYVIVGIFWLAAYLIGGWPAVLFMALLGVCGEFVLLIVVSREERDVAPEWQLRNVQDFLDRQVAMRKPGQAPESGDPAGPNVEASEDASSVYTTPMGPGRG